MNEAGRGLAEPVEHSMPPLVRKGQKEVCFLKCGPDPPKHLTQLQKASKQLASLSRFLSVALSIICIHCVSLIHFWVDSLQDILLQQHTTAPTDEQPSQDILLCWRRRRRLTRLLVVAWLLFLHVVFLLKLSNFLQLLHLVFSNLKKVN